MGDQVAGYVLLISIAALLAEVAVAARLLSLAALLRWLGARSTVPMLRARLWRATTVTALSVSSLSMTGGSAMGAAAPTALELTVDSPAVAAPIAIPGGLTMDAFAGFGLTRTTSAVLVDEPLDGVWVQVQRGDTLWDLAEAHYGHVDKSLIDMLAAVNDLADPSLIFSGQMLWFPAVAASTAVEEVVPGAGPGEATCGSSSCCW